MEREVGMDQVILFDKNEIARRLQLPMERIDLLVEECGMPTVNEEAFVQWGIQNFTRLWEEMKEFGPIAMWEKQHPISVPSSDALPSDGS